MTVRQLIPEDLAEVPPGPELARILAGIELSRLLGYDCVEALKARYRQVSHERAQLMAAMVEVGLCGIGPDDELPRRAVPDEFSADEVRAALVLTRRAADAQFWLAHDQLLVCASVWHSGATARSRQPGFCDHLLRAAGNAGCGIPCLLAAPHPLGVSSPRR